MRMRICLFATALFIMASLLPAQSSLPQPVVPENGITNGASFDGGPVAPGSIISIFGSNLGLQIVDGATTPISEAASQIPLGDSLGGHSVIFRNGAALGQASQAVEVAAPLYFVSGVADPDQINAQVPWELAGAQNVQMIVRVQDGAGGVAESAPVPVAVSPQGVSPAFFTFGVNPRRAIAVNVKVEEGDDVINGSLAHPAGVAQGGQPALQGGYLILYANGLGPVNPAAVTGDNSLDQLRSATLPPTITVGGLPTNVQFAGLTPEFVGVYQINLILDENVAPGDEVPIRIEQGGVLSREDVTIAVRARPGG